MKIHALTALLFATASPFFLGAQALTTDDAHGRVGINNTSPQYTLHVKHGDHGPQNYGNDCLAITNTGGGDTWQLFASSGDKSLIFLRNGVFEVKFTNGDGVQTLSDRNYKSGIENLPGGQLSHILALQPRTFRWKDDAEGKLHSGFIAQEVGAIYPELVSQTGEPGHETWSMSYSGMTPFLVKAMQEQQQLIDRLQAEVDRLTAAQLAVNRRIEQLEASLARPGQPENGDGKK